MSSAIGLLPANIPIDERGNLLNPAWYVFFQQLYLRAGGSVSQDNNELIAGQLDDAGIEESKADIYALRDEIGTMYCAVQALIDDLNSSPSPQPGYDYNPSLVQITGGSVSGVSIDSSPIGASSPSTGKFTGITNGNVAALIETSVAMNNGAAAALGTITNAPVAGNPTKWIPINDNGTIRYIPTW